MTETFLQNYGWVLVSLLGGLLVALMFVMGANLLLGSVNLDLLRKRAVFKAAGRKCGYAFLSLLAFGITLFLAFPVFFHTVFDSGCRVWMVLVAAFAAQWTSYAICCWTDGKLLGSAGYRILLMVIGFLAPFFLGTTIGTFFTGAEFTVDRSVTPAEGLWNGPWHGLEMLRHPQAVLLGLVHVCLSSLLGALYVIRVVDDHAVRKQMRRTVHILSVPLLVLSVVWVVFLMLRAGFSVNSDGVVSMEQYKYLMTVLHYRPVQVMFILGALLFAGGLYFGVFTKSRRKGFWLTGAGTVFVVMGIFFLAGFNGTAYFPSLTDLQSSLTIQNSSADFGTLELLSWVSPIIPVAVIGLGWLWHRTDHKKKITVRRMLREEGRR